MFLWCQLPISVLSLNWEQIRAYFSSELSAYSEVLFLLPFYAVFPGAFLGQVGGYIAMGAYAIAVPILKLTRNSTSSGKGKKKKAKGKSRA